MKRVRKAVIPVAGFGTRFLPATKSMPKEMLPIIDKPVVHYAVEEAVKAGIEEIIFVTGRGKRAIEDYFDHSYELEDQLRQKGKKTLLKEVEAISDMAEIVYIRQKDPLGLGHAILRAKELVGDEPFAVLLPDVLIPDGGNFTKQAIEEHYRSKKTVIGVQEVAWDKVSSYGIVSKEGDGESFDITGVVEKPRQEESPSNQHIFGRYVLNPSIFGYLESTKPGVGGEIQLTDAIETQVKEEGARGLVLKEEYFDTGDKLGFVKATISVALKNPDFSLDLTEYLKEIV